MTEYFGATSADEAITEFAFALAIQTPESMKPIGTAIALAPQLILTAKHVIEGMWEQYHLLREDKRSDSALIAFQVLPGTIGALWYAKNAYFSPHTDLVLLDLFPYSETASNFKWHKVRINFAPPKVGQIMAGFGYSGGQIQPSDDKNVNLKWDAHPRTTRGKVMAVYDEGRDRGLYNFPCFEMSAHVEPGMSGGPIFDEQGNLCALVCGGGLTNENNTDISYGVPLWPLLVLDGIKGKFNGEDERLFSFYGSSRNFVGKS